MARRVIVLLVALLLILGITVACSEKPGTDSTQQKMGQLEYDIIDPSSLSHDEIIAWYDENSNKEGITASEVKDDYRYILLGAGEKTTGGYSVEVTSVVGEENKIVVNGKLTGPKAGEMVTQALTYPHALIRIEKDERDIVLGDFVKPAKEEKEDTVQIIEEKGVYVGQIDNNSIEVEINGEARTFRWPDELKSQGNGNLPQPGSQVTINYYKNDLEQFILTNLHYEEELTVGTYVGQIDSNSIEIEIDGEAKAFWLSEEANKQLMESEINEGDKVGIIYEKNEYEQLVIKTIKEVRYQPN